MLDGKFDLNQISSNIVQHRPTSSNIIQNIANKRFQHLGSNMLDVVGSNMLEPFALGLTYVREQVYDIFDSLNSEEEIACENSLALLDGHFNPEVNTSYEIYLFLNLKQNTGENMQQFYIRLKQQGSKCNFKANLEKELKA